MSLKYGSYGYEFEIRELGKDEYEEWDSFVESSPQGTIFQKTCWLKSHHNFQFKIIACIHKESIAAGIPLTYTKRWGIKLAFNPPFTPYLGILFRESNQKYNVRLSFEKEFSKTIATYVRDFAPFVRYKFHYNFSDALPFIFTGFTVRPHYNYVLNLEENLDAILRNMEKDTRNRIVRASKYNLDFSDASPSEMSELVFLSFERKNKRPLRSKQEYERYLNTFSKIQAMKSLVAKDESGVLAGGSIACDTKRAYYLFGGIDLQSKYKGTGPLVVWTLMRHAKEVLGLKEFDLLGVTNENLERFYRGFGGRLTQSHVFYKNNLVYRLATAASDIRGFVASEGRSAV